MRTLYAYRPMDVRALALLLADDAEKENKVMYFANLLWMTLKCASMGSSEYPQYSDLFQPCRKRRPEKTSAEIIADVLGYLEGEDEHGKSF